MPRTGFDWTVIQKDSAKVIAQAIKNGEKVSSLPDVYELLVQYYQDRGQTDLPQERTYCRKMREMLDLQADKRSIAAELYQFAGAYSKMTLPELAQGLTVSTAATADSSHWLFIRLERDEPDATKAAKHMHFLCSELKKKFAKKILFTTFDDDTIVVLCHDDEARKKIADYLKSPKIQAQPMD